MITRESIIEELKNRGYAAEANDVVKNGVTFQGISIGTDAIRPIIYADNYIDRIDADLNTIVEEIISRYEASKLSSESINLKELLTWDYVKDNLLLCIQRKGTEELVKRDFLDLELYARVKVNFGDEQGSFKVVTQHLEALGITEDELFDAAYKCTESTIEIEDMFSTLKGMGMSTDGFDANIFSNIMIIASNTEKIYGAVAICFGDKLLEVADNWESDLAILPSSVHEVILVPVKEDTNFIYLDDMIQEINNTQLESDEFLSNHAYRFNRDEKSITYYHDGKSGKHVF